MKHYKSLEILSKFQHKASGRKRKAPTRT